MNVLSSAPSATRAGPPDEPRDDHGRWSGGGSSDKVSKAKATHKPSTKAKQDEATRAEAKVAHMLGGNTTGDNLPVDVEVHSGSKTYGVEVKSVQDNGNNKITMHPESLARKNAWAEGRGRSIHTVVVDSRSGKIYYRQGVGSFRLHTLTEVRNSAHLRSLIGIK